MESCIFGKVSGFVTAHSLCDIFYILRKDFPVKERLKLIRLLSTRCTVIPKNQDDFLLVTDNPNTIDLEDGLQMICAQKCNMDYIVTRNLKDFMNSKVKAIEPDTFLEILGQQTI